ncbi:MAG: DNA polymerase I, partial [Myxococcales bacterium]|nr:DNA polymerase I [Myxococcales bacterium]
MANKRIVLIDGSWLIFRAYFAIPANFTTAAGLPTNAIYGFAMMFRKLLSGAQPDFGAVVFDTPGRTVREEKFPAYKAQRPSVKHELKVQIPWIHKLVEAHNFPLVTLPGYEADDVIATLANQALAAGCDVVIISGDKDLAQLVSDRVRMIDTLRDVTYDPDVVRKKWGVPPVQIPDLLAIMGDKVDNIPGVPGVGQKGAAGLLTRFGSLQGIYDNIAELKGKQRQSFEENREQAFLSRELTELDLAVPVAQGFAELKVVPVLQESLNELYRELEFYSLLSRDAAGQEEVLAERDVPIVRDAATLTERLAAIDGPRALVPLFDRRMPSALTGQLVGLAVATSEESFYLALPDALTASPLFAPLARYLEDSAKPKWVHDLKSFWVLLQNDGIELAGVVTDTMLASFLVEPTKIIPHRLDQLGKEYLHRTIPQEKTLLGSGKDEKPFREIDPAMASSYAGLRAEMIAQLAPILSQKVAERNLDEQLTRDMQLSRVLGRMERTGILVDRDDLQRLGVEFAAQRDAYAASIYEMAGHPFNIGSTKQLSDVLFEELGLPVIKRTKTGYSTNQEVLERLAKEHPIADTIVKYRALAKLINTYTDVLQREVNPQTGRIHATFNQTVGASGRLISTDPDLQRTPIKTPDGKRIRQAFVPRPGCKLISADWSQIELRVLAHFSKDPLLLKAFKEEIDVHRLTASQLFGCAPEEVSPTQRNV